MKKVKVTWCTQGTEHHEKFDTFDDAMAFVNDFNANCECGYCYID